jgi:hypothetical protein
VRLRLQQAIEERDTRLKPSKEKEETNRILGQLDGLRTSLSEKQDQLPKRQAQKLRKEYEALQMYYLQQIKRGSIAKALKLSPQQVSEIIEKFKRDMRKLVQAHGQEELKQSNEKGELFSEAMIEEVVSQRKRGAKLGEKISKSKNPALIEAMSSHFN